MQEDQETKDNYATLLHLTLYTSIRLLCDGSGPFILSCFTFKWNGNSFAKFFLFGNMGVDFSDKCTEISTVSHKHILAVLPGERPWDVELELGADML